ncbi:MAG: tetratricopeptide repeat protein, partial [Nitrospira sp.]
MHSRRAGSVDSSASSALLREAQMHHQAGRLDEAERAYRLLLDRAPAQPDALHGLGLLTYRRGNAKD